MKGLYEKLSNQVSSLDKKVYSKSSLVSICHSIEDIVLHFRLKAEIYVFFQDYEFFICEREKYTKLDDLCEKIFIFAKNIRFDEGSHKEIFNAYFSEFDEFLSC